MLAPLTHCAGLGLKSISPWQPKALQLDSFFFFVFVGPHLRHMEVPRLGVELELQLLAYATATAMPDLSCL